MGMYRKCVQLIYFFVWMWRWALCPLSVVSSFVSFSGELRDCLVPFPKILRSLALRGWYYSIQVLGVVVVPFRGFYLWIGTAKDDKTVNECHQEYPSRTLVKVFAQDV